MGSPGTAHLSSPSCETQSLLITLYQLLSLFLLYLLTSSLSFQVPKVTKAHPDPLDLQALQALLDLPEAEDPKAFGSQTCSMANVQVTTLSTNDPKFLICIPVLVTRLFKTEGVDFP